MDDEELYTDEEFANFEHEREAAMPQGYGAYGNIPAMPPMGYGHPGGVPQAAMYPPGGGLPPQYGMGGGPGQYGAAMHPNQFAPGPPMPGVDRNGVPMHGSVPGQPANPQFVPGQPPHMQPGYQQQQQFAGQPQQVGGQPPQPGQFAAQPQPGQFAGQPQPQPGQPQPQPGQYAGQPQQG